MVFTDLVKRISRRHPDYHDETIKQCTHLIVAQLDESLVMGRGAQIRGFGSFTLRRRAARTVRDPRNGESVSLPETHVPHFKLSPKIHTAINKSVLENENS